MLIRVRHSEPTFLQSMATPHLFTSYRVSQINNTLIWWHLLCSYNSTSTSVFSSRGCNHLNAFQCTHRSNNTSIAFLSGFLKVVASQWSRLMRSMHGNTMTHTVCRTIHLNELLPHLPPAPQSSHAELTTQQALVRVSIFDAIYNTIPDRIMHMWERPHMFQFLW